jgi:hypothetical protein
MALIGLERILPMAHNHDPHMDALFRGYLVSNGVSAAGADQIIQELVVTDPQDRKIIYEVMREYILPESSSVPKSRYFRHGR